MKTTHYSARRAYYSEHGWNIVFSVLFLLLSISFVSLLKGNLLQILAGITPFYFIVLSLATFRLTCLLISDHITQWVRDLFVRVSFEKDEASGAEFISRTKVMYGPRVILAQLFGCPWCMGVWSASIVLVLFIISVVTPSGLIGLLFVMILAVSGAAALLQNLSTKITGGSTTRNSTSSNVCTDCGK